MGISGLLKFLQGYATRTSLSNYSGKVVAVDVSWWIHQGAYKSDFWEGIEGSVKKIIQYVLK